MQHAMRTMHPASYTLQRATRTMCHSICTVRHLTCSMQHVTDTTAVLFYSHTRCVPKIADAPASTTTDEDAAAAAAKITNLLGGLNNECTWHMHVCGMHALVNGCIHAGGGV